MDCRRTRCEASSLRLALSRSRRPARRLPRKAPFRDQGRHRGALAQGLLAVAISCSSGFWPYAVGAVFFPFVMLFTHTFIFGHLARIEPTGRAVAATPAMIMAGSTIAPLFGGVLVQTIGYPALGVAAFLFAAVAIALYVASRKYEGAKLPSARRKSALFAEGFDIRLAATRARSNGARHGTPRAAAFPVRLLSPFSRRNAELAFEGPHKAVSDWYPTESAISDSGACDRSAAVWRDRAGFG